MITQKLLRELFNYREDGFLIRKTSAGGNKIGTVVGSINRRGYMDTKIDSKNYKIHRLIYLLYHGYLPKFLDHRDKVRDNNRIDNLRPATKKQNSRNKVSQKGSSSEYLGVCRNGKKWRVRIKLDVNEKDIELGAFVNEEDAARAYDKAAREHFGEWASLNFK